MAPGFLRRERENRREQPAKRFEDFEHRPLRRPTPWRIRRIAIKAVFRDIYIETAQINGAKMIERVIHFMKLECFVGGSTVRDHLVKPLKNPAINQGEAGIFCSGGLR